MSVTSKNLYDGSFIKLPEVETYQGKSISIVSDPKNTIFLETDGESLGHSPLEFSIIPSSIKLIAHKKSFSKKMVSANSQRNKGGELA